MGRSTKIHVEQCYTEIVIFLTPDVLADQPLNGIRTHLFSVGLCVSGCSALNPRFVELLFLSFPSRCDPLESAGVFPPRICFASR